MTYHVKDLEAGPLLDQAVLRALGAVHMQECPEGAPDSVRDNWPESGAMVLTDEAGNQMFYSIRTIPQFSTDWGVGGPVLFDKERISILSDGPGWRAGLDAETLAKEYVYCSSVDDDDEDDDEDLPSSKPEVTALVAACREFVLASIAGETVELFDPFARFGTPSVVQGPPR